MFTEQREIKMLVTTLCDVIDKRKQIAEKQQMKIITCW